MSYDKEVAQTRPAIEQAVKQLRDGNLALHGTQFDQYRLSMLLAATILEVMLEDAPTPIDMILHCPACGMQHIDAPEHWDGEVKVHRSHLCVPAAGGCGHIWRPADMPTNGVQAIATRGKDDMSTLPQRSAGDIHQIIERAIQGVAGRSLTLYDYEEVFACCQAAILAARR